MSHGRGAKRRVGWVRERRSARTGHRSRVAATPTARLPRCDVSTVSSCRPAALSCFRHIPNPCAQPDLLGPQSHVARHLPFHPHTLTKDAKASLPPARRCPVFCVCVSTLACQCASSHSRFRIRPSLPPAFRAHHDPSTARTTHARTPEDALRSKRAEGVKWWAMMLVVNSDLTTQTSTGPAQNVAQRTNKQNYPQTRPRRAALESTRRHQKTGRPSRHRGCFGVFG